MPRFRIAFSREWALGRWGYLDRFFHDLGGHQSEPSGLDNAWIVEYRGQPRHLGRELAKALHIQETDYQQFGPIFDIEEIAPQRRPRRDSAESLHAAAPGSAPVQGQAPPTPAAAPAPVAEPQQGPSWLADTEVEDVTLEQAADLASGPAAKKRKPAGLSAQGADADAPEGGSSAGAQARWDDLFRIRSRSNPGGRRRAEAISGASRRRPPTGRPSSE